MKEKKPFKSQYDSFELFKLAINHYNKLKSEAAIFINKNNPLICKRTEIDWLISKNKSELLQRIAENDGIYTFYTLQDMTSISFINTYIDSILIKNRSQIVKFKKFNNTGVIFSFNKFGHHPPVLFAMHINDFMQYIGANFIINHNFTYSSKDILKNSYIINSKNNLISILEYTDNMLNLLSCAFFDDASNSLYIYRKGDKAIKQFSIYKFMRNYSRLMLSSDEQIKKYLTLLIKGNTSIKWISLEVQSKQGIDDKIGKLYKSYKDSNEYYVSPFNT